MTMDDSAESLALPAPRRRRSRAPRLPFGGAIAWVLAGVALVCAGAVWWWSGHGTATGPATGAGSAAASGQSRGTTGRRFGGTGAAQPVSVQPVRRQDIRVSGIGSMEASNTAVVHAQVSGVLRSLNFKEGEQVRAGQTLAQIDPRAFAASLARAECALARYKAQLEGARVDLTRYRDLLAKDAIARQQVDTQEALVHQLEGTVRADQGNVDSARLQLSYARVTAPINGRVGLKQVDLGNVVQPADTNGIASITQTRPIAMVCAVPAAHVPLITERLRANATVTVEAWDRSGKVRLAIGRVSSIDNAIDPSTDTIKVKALFPNDDDALFPNQAVSVVCCHAASTVCCWPSGPFPA